MYHDYYKKYCEQSDEQMTCLWCIIGLFFGFVIIIFGLMFWNEANSLPVEASITESTTETETLTPITITGLNPTKIPKRDLSEYVIVDKKTGILFLFGDKNNWGVKEFLCPYPSPNGKLMKLVDGKIIELDN
jgi:hypothetical protein